MCIFVCISLLSFGEQLDEFAQLFSEVLLEVQGSINNLIFVNFCVCVFWLFLPMHTQKLGSPPYFIRVFFSIQYGFIYMFFKYIEY